MLKILKNKPFRSSFLVASLVAAFLLSGGIKKVHSSLGNTYEKLKIFAEVTSLIESSYVEEVQPDRLIEGAIQGMLKNLDPHSSYLSFDSYKEMKVETEGEFGGLGIEITIRNNLLTIVSPIEDTPAYRSGVQAGDIIMKIDDKPTRDMSLPDAVKKLRGPVNTKVTITILRKEFKTLKDFTITRAIIKMKSVWSRRMEDNIGYIRVRNFAKTTTDEVKKALEKFSEEGALKGLVLDVRNNPGGLLNQSVGVSNIFLKKGALIVYTEGRTPDQNMTFKTQKSSKYVDLPLVILVNGGSASASEIVAGALKDLNRAIVMGTKTFGKGSVQTIIPLSDGSGLRLTTAKYFTPSGKVIEKNGIDPNIIVENPVVKPDAKEEKSEEKLNAGQEKDTTTHFFGTKDKTPVLESEQPDNNTPKDEKEARFLKGYKKDIQLQRAVGLLKGVELFQDILQKKAS
ncbi:MAG: S41 family peptidase [Nitrospinota bacterium]